MEASALDFLKRLCESFGPSGFKTEPLRVVKQYVQPFADEIRSDRLGSLRFTARGPDRPVVIVPGLCPTVVIGVPTRHIHSHVGMLSLEDVDNAVSRVTAIMSRLDAKTVESFTAV